MASRSAKPKRSDDVKKILVPALHELTKVSFKFNEDLDTANDDFVLMFKSMGERQSEMYARSVDIDEKYGALLGMLKGDTISHSGESSSTPPDFPASYASDTRKFIDDSAASLNSHTKGFVEKVEQMMKEVDENAAIWKGKLIEMKKQAEHITHQRTKSLVSYQNSRITCSFSHSNVWLNVEISISAFRLSINVTM